jgi:NAD(P)-dependent dehydrogenase (short-subunit alcohol dehydrogenase family)
MSFEPQARLDGKVAVITGGKGAIGICSARRLATLGARIVSIDRNPQGVQALLDGLKLPETAERLKATDQLVIGSTPEEAAARIAKDYAKWGAVTKKIGLSLE